MSRTGFRLSGKAWSSPEVASTSLWECYWPPLPHSTRSPLFCRGSFQLALRSRYPCPLCKSQSRGTSLNRHPPKVVGDFLSLGILLERGDQIAIIQSSSNKCTVTWNFRCTCTKVRKDTPTTYFLLFPASLPSTAHEVKPAMPWSVGSLPTHSL